MVRPKYMTKQVLVRVQCLALIHGSILLEKYQYIPPFSWCEGVGSNMQSLRRQAFYHWPKLLSLLYYLLYCITLPQHSRVILSRTLLFSQYDICFARHLERRSLHKMEECRWPKSHNTGQSSVMVTHTLQHVTYYSICTEQLIIFSQLFSIFHNITRNIVTSCFNVNIMGSCLHLARPPGRCWVPSAYIRVCYGQPPYLSLTVWNASSALYLKFLVCCSEISSRYVQK